MVDSSDEEFWTTAWDLSVLEPIGVGLEYEAFFETFSVLIGEKVTLTIKTAVQTRDDATRLINNITILKA